MLGSAQRLKRTASDGWLVAEEDVRFTAGTVWEGGDSLEVAMYVCTYIHKFRVNSGTPPTYKYLCKC